MALPAEATLTDLLPAVLPQFGAEWIEQGADHEGWVVQRVGEQPLDEDRTLAELHLFDGETVYLRPRADQLAPIDFDDLVAGVGEQVRGHQGTWEPRHSRWLFRIGAGCAFLLGLAVLPGPGPVGGQAAVALMLAVLLLPAAGLIARGAADTCAATIVAGAAAGYGGLGGGLLVHGLAPLASVAVQVTTGLSVALVLLGAGAFLVADSALLFAGAIMFALELVLTGAIASAAEISLPQAAGIGLAAGLIIGVFLPATAFRLSGLALPMLPADKDELSEDIDPVPAKLIVERGAVTVGYSTALHTGLGTAFTLLLPLLLSGGSYWETVLALVIALLLFLRVRHPAGVAQRWATLTPAVVAALTTVVHLAGEQPGATRLLTIAAPVFLVGVLLMLASRTLPGRRLRPYWGRAVEIFESVTAIAVVPVLLQVLGGYAWMRGLAG